MVAYNYYLGPCVWDASDPSEPHWRAPTGTVGWVDLASMPQLGKPGADREVGFFACNSLLPSEYVLIGQGDCREMPSSAAIASAWKSQTGYSPQASGTLIDMLADHLMNGCDPQGLNSCYPLVPTADRQIEIHLGGHSVVWQKRFVWDNQRHCNNLKALLQADLLACRADSLAGKRGLHGPDHDFHRRLMQGHLEKYGITFADIRPAGWPTNETPLPHQTTITDDFTRADGTTIGHLLTWTEVLNDVQTKSNTICCVTTGARCDARAESDLSSSDHYGQIDVMTLNVVGTTTRNAQVACRFASAADTLYSFLYANNASGQQIQLLKVVAGVQTTIGGPTTETESLPATLKCQGSGSTISGYVGGVSKFSVTDTSIASGTRCGFAIRSDTADTVGSSVDNFAAADLAAAGVLYTQLERSIRGICRGMYQHH